LALNPATAPVGHVDRAMIDYAVKLTRTPGGMERGDVETLRRVGFSDRAILDINGVTAYFNFVNRIADGLGVELERFWDEPAP